MITEVLPLLEKQTESNRNKDLSHMQVASIDLTTKKSHLDTGFFHPRS